MGSAISEAMAVKKISWRSMLPICYRPAADVNKEKNNVAKRSSWHRVSISDLSNMSSSTLSKDLSALIPGAKGGRSQTTFRQATSLALEGLGPYTRFIDDMLRLGLYPQPIAIKLLDLDGLQGHREWLTEVIFLGQPRHPHLEKLIGYCYENEHWLLMHEYIPRGRLENQLFRGFSAALPWSTRMKIDLGAVKVLAFLHEAEKSIIYQNFKGSNILLDSMSKSDFKFFKCV